MSPLNNGEMLGSYRQGNQIYKIFQKRNESEKDTDDRPDTLLNRHELELMDRNVRNHEQSHMNALGPYASSQPVYTTLNSLDGSSYANGASIKVDLSSIPGDPQATLRKAYAIFNASQAPHSPSSADQNVASLALRLGSLAKRELEKSAIHPENTGLFSSRYSINAESIYQSNQYLMESYKKAGNGQNLHLLDLLV